MNLCTNGSFETDTAGFTTQGPNTFTSSADVCKFGTKSGKLTQVASAYFRSVVYPVTLTAVPHIISCYVYIPAAASISNGIALEVRDWAGGTGTDSEGTETNVRNAWTRITVPITPVAGDLAGNIYVNFHSAADGAVIYLDGFQIEVGTVATGFGELSYAGEDPDDFTYAGSSPDVFTYEGDD